MKFSWDPQKAESNKLKHGITFEEASEIFDDPLHISILDVRYSYFEERWITMGLSGCRKLIVTAYLFFDEEGESHIRIISAREAGVHERRQYEEG